MSYGLRPEPRTAIDKRFSLTRRFGTPSLDLPREFDVENEKGDIRGPRSQRDNHCTAETLAEIGSDEHGIPMSADFQAMLISLISGYPIHTMGATIKNAMKSGNLFGFLPEDKTPEVFKDKDEAYVNETANWDPKLLEIAEQYRARGGHFLVDGPYDHFDNFRAHLNQHAPDNGIAIGIPWYRSFNDTPSSGIVPAGDELISWHAITVKGFRRVDGQDVIRVRSWSGKRFGNRSYAYFTRARFNELLSVPGAEGRMYKDIPDDAIAALKAERLNLSEVFLNFYYKLIFNRTNPSMFKTIAAFMDFISELFNRRIAKTPPAPLPVPTPEPPKPAPEPEPTPIVPVPPPAPAKPVLSFATAKDAFLSTRMICDELGVSLARNVMVNGKAYQAKDIICACIMQESGFLNRKKDGSPVKYENKDADTGEVWSTDWGIVQINDYWNIGKGKPFPSVQYVLDHPERCVRWMVQMYLAGKLNLWSSYKGGHYKQWLKDGSAMWKLRP